MTAAAISFLLRRATLLALALVALHVPLVPVSHAADRAALPDLLFCLLAAWIVRRPEAAPLALVLALGLAADVLLARPLGLGTLALVLASEVLRTRLRPTHFASEWLAVAALFGGMLAGMTLLLGLALAPVPGGVPLLHHWIATMAAYPFVAALVHGASRLGARA